MPVDTEKEYQKMVKELAKNMFIDWLERMKKGQVRQDALERVDKTELGQKILKRSYQTGQLIGIPEAIDEEIARLKAARDQ